MGNFANQSMGAQHGKLASDGCCLATSLQKVFGRFVKQGAQVPIAESRENELTLTDGLQKRVVRIAERIEASVTPSVVESWLTNTGGFLMQ